MNKSVDVNNDKAPYETSKPSEFNWICAFHVRAWPRSRVLFHSPGNDVQNSTTTKSSEGESSNDDSEEEDSLGKVLTKGGKEIDRKSAGNVKRSKEEARADDEPENEFGYTDSKWLTVFGRNWPSQA